MALLAKLVTAIVINAVTYVAREKVVPIVSKKIKSKIQELKDGLKNEEEEIKQTNTTIEESKTEEDLQKEIFVPKWDKEL